MSFHVPNQFRLRNGQFTSDDLDGNNGCFLLTMPFYDHNSVRSKLQFRVIASDGMGWEHVSVSTKVRCPKWEEMCIIKDMFWDETDTVIQYHPSKTDYVNNHPFCLHLWRPTKTLIPVPDSILVGIKASQTTL